MTEAKPTPGPWTIGHSPTGANRVVAAEGLNGNFFVAKTEGPDAEANARLIAEAGTVYHETGLTPRQLAEQRAELLEAQERLLRRAESLIAAGKGLPFKPSFGMLVIEWLREVAKEGK